MEENGEELVKALLGLNRNAVGFRERLQALIGVFEDWGDEDDVHFTTKGRGLEILTGPEGDVTAIFLFGTESREVSRYKGMLPAGLDFEFSRDQVRLLLGEPDESGESKLHLGDVLPPWDKYGLTDYSLHARYVHDGSTMTHVTLTPRRSLA